MTYNDTTNKQKRGATLEERWEGRLTAEAESDSPPPSAAAAAPVVVGGMSAEGHHACVFAAVFPATNPRLESVHSLPQQRRESHSLPAEARGGEVR